MFNFEKLEVWQKAIDFADFVYSVTRTFPDDERFGLTNQMRRAAVSISSNIAEGSSRSSRSDFARFVELATGSIYEVVSQATIGKRQRFLTEQNYGRLYSACEEQSKMLSGLRRRLWEELRVERAHDTGLEKGTTGLWENSGEFRGTASDEAHSQLSTKNSQPSLNRLARTGIEPVFQP